MADGGSISEVYLEITITSVIQFSATRGEKKNAYTAFKDLFFPEREEKNMNHIGPEIFRHFKTFCADLVEYLQNSEFQGMDMVHGQIW